MVWFGGQRKGGKQGYDMIGRIGCLPEDDLRGENAAAPPFLDGNTSNKYKQDVERRWATTAGKRLTTRLKRGRDTLEQSPQVRT